MLILLTDLYTTSNMSLPVVVPCIVVTSKSSSLTLMSVLTPRIKMDNFAVSVFLVLSLTANTHIFKYFERALLQKCTLPKTLCSQAEASVYIFCWDCRLFFNSLTSWRFFIEANSSILSSVFCVESAGTSCRPLLTQPHNRHTVFSPRGTNKYLAYHCLLNVLQ